jgi:hypothetical protein
MEILVFKTNIRSKKQVGHISAHLLGLDGISKWNVDLLDCDKILRIEAIQLEPHLIETVIKKAGYECEELRD